MGVKQFAKGAQVEVQVADKRGLLEYTYKGVVTGTTDGLYEVTDQDGVVHKGVFGVDMTRCTPV